MSEATAPCAKAVALESQASAQGSQSEREATEGAAFAPLQQSEINSNGNAGEPSHSIGVDGALDLHEIRGGASRQQEEEEEDRREKCATRKEGSHAIRRRRTPARSSAEGGEQQRDSRQNGAAIGADSAEDCRNEVSVVGEEAGEGEGEASGTESEHPGGAEVWLLSQQGEEEAQGVKQQQQQQEEGEEAGRPREGEKVRAEKNAAKFVVVQAVGEGVNEDPQTPSRQNEQQGKGEKPPELSEAMDEGVAVADENARAEADFEVHIDPRALEMDVVASILLREEQIERLVEACAARPLSYDGVVAHTLVAVRNASVRLVLKLKALLQASGVDFEWLGQPYVFKMLHDLDFLAGVPEVRGRLNFSLVHNPLILEPSGNVGEKRALIQDPATEFDEAELSEATEFMGQASVRRKQAKLLLERDAALAPLKIPDVGKQRQNRGTLRDDAHTFARASPAPTSNSARQQNEHKRNATQHLENREAADCNGLVPGGRWSRPQPRQTDTASHRFKLPSMQSERGQATAQAHTQHLASGNRKASLTPIKNPPDRNTRRQASTKGWSDLSSTKSFGTIDSWSMSSSHYGQHRRSPKKKSKKQKAKQLKLYVKMKWIWCPGSFAAALGVLALRARLFHCH